MTSDPAVTVDGLGVAYRTPVGSSRWWQPTPTRTVTALHQVDLEIEHGTAVGIIGANGAGKTSLLRAIAGIVPPSAGRITVRGDVTAMLSLDVGINPDLTGEENIELGGLARGLTRDQIVDRTPDIARFSGVAEVLDQPVRSYSSGMRARLAFAIAVNVDPDILLLDEALSTGDTAFRRASAARMRDLVDQASTILLVSHNLKAITDLCDRAIWLDRGTVVADDTAHDVVRAYRRHLDQGAQS